MIPNIAEVYRLHIANELGVKVFSSKPATRPPKCVVLTPIPGGASDKPQYFAWRRFLVHCWDSSDGNLGEAAGVLSERLRQVFIDSAKLISGVHKVRIIGEPGRYDDPRESTPRFQQIVDVQVKNK